MTPSEIAAWRAHVQRLWGPKWSSPAECFTHLGAVQSQEFHSYRLTPAMRTVPGGAGRDFAPRSAVDALVDAGAVVRTHVLRPTWHTVPVADIRMMLAATADRVLQFFGPATLRSVDLDAATLNVRHRVARGEHGYELEDGTLPHNLIVDRKGMVWYAGNGNGHIGKLDPATGKIAKYPMPNPEARDPHTLIFDQKGDIWFTVQGGDQIGFLKPCAVARAIASSSKAGEGGSFNLISRVIRLSALSQLILKYNMDLVGVSRLACRRAGEAAASD
jgi:hypothetical protein